MKGHGFFSNLLASVKSGAAAVVKRVKDVAKGVRLDYSPPVRKLLSEIGEFPVVGMVVRRDPIQSALHTVLNLVTLGKWNAFRQRYNYDKVFHLGIEVVVQLGDETNAVARYVIEKNEVINVAPSKAYTRSTETWGVPLEGSTTINALLQRTQQRMGPLYFVYDAFTNNCQDFILSLLIANGLSTPFLTQVVKQPVEAALEMLPSYTSRVARAVTDAAAIGSVALYGQGALKAFASQLKKADVDQSDYLEMAKRVAQRAGYPPHSLQWSNKTGKKLMMKTPDGKTVHFGAVNHGDFLFYSLSGDQKLADQKRRSYLARATRIRGDWRSDKYSPNNLAIRILWAMVNPK